MGEWLAVRLQQMEKVAGGGYVEGDAEQAREEAERVKKKRKGKDVEMLSLLLNHPLWPKPKAGFPALGFW